MGIWAGGAGAGAVDGPSGLNSGPSPSALACAEASASGVPKSAGPLPLANGANGAADAEVAPIVGDELASFSGCTEDCSVFWQAAPLTSSATNRQEVKRTVRSPELAFMRCNLLCDLDDCHPGCRHDPRLCHVPWTNHV